MSVITKIAGAVTRHRKRKFDISKVNQSNVVYAEDINIEDISKGIQMKTVAT